jgi:glycosyltransferase involved in cell wall biosynthesis
MHRQSAAAAPLVSIGMPAYNAGSTIAASIECLLAQTFSDLELVISDNASTDDTWSIVTSYAQRDARVIGLRQPQNVGANGNYSAVFGAARGRYFKWASSNDWCAPEFLERCIAHLESHVDTVLVAPRTRLFDSTPDAASDYAKDMGFAQPNPVDRFIDVGMSLALNNVLNGVVRSDALRRTRLIEHYPGADVVLVGHLALLGRIDLLDAPLFYRRMDPGTATRLMSAEAVHRHHYPQQTVRAMFPAWRNVAGWIRAVLSTRLPWSDTRRALSWVARNAYWNRAALTHDLVQALHWPMQWLHHR